MKKSNENIKNKYKINRKKLLIKAKELKNAKDNTDDDINKRTSSGDFLAFLRKESGLNQAQLGSLLSLSFQTISKYENNASLPDVFTLKEISKIFGITADEFYAGTYDFNKRRMHRIKIFFNFFACIFFVLALPTLFYFTFSYYKGLNSEHIYYISEDNGSNVVSLRGVYYKSNYLNQIYVSSISFLNDSDADFEIRTLHDDRIIHHFSSNKDLVIKFDKKINALDEVKFDVIIGGNEYIFGIKEYDYFQNFSGFETRSIFPYYKKGIDKNEIIKILKRDNFENLYSNIWRKDDGNIKVQISLNKTIEITLSEESGDYQKRITYVHSSQTLDVAVFQKGNIQTPLEIGKYYYETGKYNCASKDCISLKDALKTMEKYRILFFGEYN